jgi:hypothetical protein
MSTVMSTVVPDAGEAGGGCTERVVRGSERSTAFAVAG